MPIEIIKGLKRRICQLFQRFALGRHFDGNGLANGRQWHRCDGVGGFS
jgi:hypothetical protein